LKQFRAMRVQMFQHGRPQQILGPVLQHTLHSLTQLFLQFLHIKPACVHARLPACPWLKHLYFLIAGALRR
jgi:hypothetical protein